MAGDVDISAFYHTISRVVGGSGHKRFSSIESERVAAENSEAAAEKYHGAHDFLDPLKGVKLMNHLGHKGGPTGLVTGSHARAVVAVEVFMELDQIPPMGILVE